MYEILAMSMQIIVATLPTPAPTVVPPEPPCHWLAVELPARYELRPSARQRACKWEPTLRALATKHSIDPDLFGALIIVESRWKPWVVSRANACGVTQVIPKWTGGRASGRRKWTCEELKAPHNGLRAGAQIFGWWLGHRKGDEREALCGYNAGFRTCKRAGASYARAVMHLRELLRAARTPKNAGERDI